MWSLKTHLQLLFFLVRPRRIFAECKMFDLCSLACKLAFVKSSNSCCVVAAGTMAVALRLREAIDTLHPMIRVLWLRFVDIVIIVYPVSKDVEKDKFDAIIAPYLTKCLS